MSYGSSSFSSDLEGEMGNPKYCSVILICKMEHY